MASTAYPAGNPMLAWETSRKDASYYSWSQNKSYWMVSLVTMSQITGKMLVQI